MFNKKPIQPPPMSERAKSISSTKFAQHLRNQSRPWDWEPDEVSNFGNRRLLRSVILSDKAIDDPIETEEDREDYYDLLASLITDSYNEVIEIYKDFTKLHENWGDLSNHPEKYPNEGYPRNTDYRWRCKKRHRDKSITEVRATLKVGIYVEKIFGYFVKIMEDDDIFPAQDLAPFPEDFPAHVKKLNKLLFRILAIMFSNEHETVHSLGRPLKEALQKVLYYSWKWELLDEKDPEFECIDFLVTPIRKQYEIDYEGEKQNIK